MINFFNIIIIVIYLINKKMKRLDKKSLSRFSEGDLFLPMKKSCKKINNYSLIFLEKLNAQETINDREDNASLQEKMINSRRCL